MLVRRDGPLCSNLYTASNQLLLNGDYSVSYVLGHFLDYQARRTGTLGFKRTLGCDPLSPMYSKLLSVQGEDFPPLVIIPVDVSHCKTMVNVSTVISNAVSILYQAQDLGLFGESRWEWAPPTGLAHGVCMARDSIVERAGDSSPPERTA